MLKNEKIRVAYRLKQLPGIQTEHIEFVSTPGEAAASSQNQTVHVMTTHSDGWVTHASDDCSGLLKGFPKRSWRTEGVRSAPSWQALIITTIHKKTVLYVIRQKFSRWCCFTSFVFICWHNSIKKQHNHKKPGKNIKYVLYSEFHLQGHVYGEPSKIFQVGYFLINLMISPYSQ